MVLYAEKFNGNACDKAKLQQMVFGTDGFVFKTGPCSCWNCMCCYHNSLVVEMLMDMMKRAFL